MIVSKKYIKETVKNITKCDCEAEKFDSKGIVNIIFKQIPDYRDLISLRNYLRNMFPLTVKQVFYDENNNEITPESIIADEIKKDIESIGSQFKGKLLTKDTVQSISYSLNSCIKKLIVSNKLVSGITAKATSSKDMVTVNFYYNNRKLVLKDFSDLVNFNENDYFYEENGKIIRSAVLNKPVNFIDSEIYIPKEKEIIKDYISIEGNKGGDFVEIEDNSDGTIRLRSGHCCVISIDATVPNEFLSALLSQKMLECGNDTNKVIDSFGWDNEYKNKLKSKVSKIKVKK